MRFEVDLFNNVYLKVMYLVAVGTLWLKYSERKGTKRDILQKRAFCTPWRFISDS